MTPGETRDRLEEALLALRTVTDLAASCRDLHLISPDGLSVLLGLLLGQAEEHLARLERPKAA